MFAGHRLTLPCGCRSTPKVPGECERKVTSRCLAAYQRRDPRYRTQRAAGPAVDSTAGPALGAGGYWNVVALSFVTRPVPVSTLASTGWPSAALTAASMPSEPILAGN